MFDLENFDVRKYDQVIDGKYIGYHHDLNSLPIKCRDIVTVKKGTKYHSMRDGEYHIAKRSFNVVVDHLIHGAQYTEGAIKIVKNTMVTWAGSGGYWHRADINDLELKK